MASLPIKNALRLCEPFVDYLNITTPHEDGQSVLDALRPLFDTIGASNTYEGLYELPNKSGTFKHYRRGAVSVFSASGSFLSVLRGKGLYAEYLMAYAHRQHRISMMHVACDFRVDAPPMLRKVFSLGKSGKLHLTRKAVDPKHISMLIGPNLEGVETGTAYFGNRSNSDVWAKVYDKRQERVAKGYDDPGHTLRVEIAYHSDVGCTLRDASVPSDLFYYAAARSLVEPPPDYSGWVPHGEGFEIERPAHDLTVHQRMWGLVEGSSDIGRLLQVAHDEYGSKAVQELTKLLEKRYRLYSNGLAL